jgi:hypothetical protein
LAKSTKRWLGLGIGMTEKVVGHVTRDLSYKQRIVAHMLLAKSFIACASIAPMLHACSAFVRLTLSGR